jgi:hypothetical protein
MKKFLLAAAALLTSPSAFAQSAPVLQGYYLLHGTMDCRVLGTTASYSESVVGDVNFRPGGQETSYLSVSTTGTEGQATNNGFSTGSGSYAAGATTFAAAFLPGLTFNAAYGVADASGVSTRVAFHLATLSGNVSCRYEGDLSQ